MPQSSSRCPWDELRTLSDAGWEIGSHTVYAPASRHDLPSRRSSRSWRESRRHCEVNLGRDCLSLAYPYGDFDDRVISAARSAGYLTAATLPRRFEGKNPLAWSRVGIYRTDGPLTYRLKISAAVRRLRKHAPRPPLITSSAAEGEVS